MAHLRVVTTPASTLACLVADTVVSVVRLPALEVACELGIDVESDVAIVRDRVVVLAPSGRLCLVDPAGPHLLDERAVAPGTRMLAASSAAAVLGGPRGPALLELDDGALRVRALPAREPITAAGTTPDPARFLVAQPGYLEERCATSRAPLRRFRLARPIAPRLLGATAGSVWCVPESAPAELVVLPARPGGASFGSELPEPIARVLEIASGTLLVIGAVSRAAWLIKLGERRIEPLGVALDDAARWRDGTCVLARCGGLELVPVIEREPARLAS